MLDRGMFITLKICRELPFYKINLRLNALAYFEPSDLCEKGIVQKLRCLPYLKKAHQKLRPIECGWASDILLPKKGKMFVCEWDCDQTLGSILAKFWTQVFRRKILVRFVNGPNRFNCKKCSHNLYLSQNGCSKPYIEVCLKSIVVLAKILIFPNFAVIIFEKLGFELHSGPNFKIGVRVVNYDTTLCVMT